jgi:hypothetical protein
MKDDIDKMFDSDDEDKITLIGYSNPFKGINAQHSIGSWYHYNSKKDLFIIHNRGNDTYMIIKVLQSGACKILAKEIGDEEMVVNIIKKNGG